MAEMRQATIKAFIRWGEAAYVAECVDLPVVTQGATIDETIRNLREALALHLQGEDLAELGFTSSPTLLVVLELGVAHA